MVFSTKKLINQGKVQTKIHFFPKYFIITIYSQIKFKKNQ